MTRAEIYYRILEIGVEQESGITLNEMLDLLNLPKHERAIEKFFAIHFQRGSPERTGVEMALSWGQIGPKGRSFLNTHPHYLKPEAAKEFLSLSYSKSMLEDSKEEAIQAKKHSRMAITISVCALLLSVFGSIPDWKILKSTPTKTTDTENITLINESLIEIQNSLKALSPIDTATVGPK